MYASLKAEMSKAHNNSLMENPAKTKGWGRGVQTCSLRATVLQSLAPSIIKHTWTS